MVSTALIFTVSALSFIVILKLGLSILVGVLKFFKGFILAVILAMFLLAVWSDPGGTANFFRGLFAFIYRTVS